MGDKSPSSTTAERTDLDICGFMDIPSDCTLNLRGFSPWEATGRSSELVSDAIQELDGEYQISGEIAVHKTAEVESGAVLKRQVIVGPGAFIASGAYLRNGCYLGRECIVGPGCELRSSFLISRSKIAHLSFIGDSLIGTDCNIEAGAMIANYRNEQIDKVIEVVIEDKRSSTGVDKFGALVGDECRIGANAVLAPGTLLNKNTVIGRLQLIDQLAEIDCQSCSTKGTHTKK